MTTKPEIYRKQVAIGFAMKTGITFDEAVAKLAEHEGMIDAWRETGVLFKDTAAVLVGEMRPEMTGEETGPERARGDVDERIAASLATGIAPVTTEQLMRDLRAIVNEHREP